MRREIIESIKYYKNFDLIIVGGGITGAGIFRKASMMGFKCLLVEQRDFSWGTSSRSGKLVHGGLRYIKEGKLNLTYHSVREREKLIHSCKSLVKPLPFALPVLKNDLKSKFMYSAGLSLYDLFAGEKESVFKNKNEILARIPHFADNIDGAFLYMDAKTDDASLTFNIILEGVSYGGIAINYAKVEELLEDNSGGFKGVVLKIEGEDKEIEVTGKAIVLSTGAWIDEFSDDIKIRKLKGSHLILPLYKLPLSFAVVLIHPADKRPLYIFPWHGTILLGTTDLDYKDDLNNEPNIDSYEVDYLLSALKYWFPFVEIHPEDVISSFSGIRAVLDTGKKNPSKETRDYILKHRRNLFFISGGKLTTFDYIAKKVIREVAKEIVFGKSIGRLEHKGDFRCRDLKDSKELFTHGYIVHLDDFLIRRTRVGLLDREGGFSQLGFIRKMAGEFLQWDNARWEREVSRYKKILKHYRLPEA